MDAESKIKKIGLKLYIQLILLEKGILMSIKIKFNDGKILNLMLDFPIGCGGSKCAFVITDDLVLLLPNIRGILDKFVNWKRIVNEEYQISQILTNIGIYNPNHEKVEVLIEDKLFESYVSKSFEGLKSSGINVIDTKNFDPELYHIFYDPNIDLSDPNNWYPILSNLMNDIILLYKYNIPVSSDSTNFALINQKDINLISPCEIRFFGFDFTSKMGPIKINPIPKSWNTGSNFEIKLGWVFKILYKAMELLMFSALDDKYKKEHVVMPKEYEEILENLHSIFIKKMEDLYYSDNHFLNASFINNREANIHTIHYNSINYYLCYDKEER